MMSIKAMTNKLMIMVTPCYDWYNRGRGLTCAAPDLYDTLERPQALLPVCRDI